MIKSEQNEDQRKKLRKEKYKEKNLIKQFRKYK